MFEEKYLRYNLIEVDAKFRDVSLDKLLYEGEELYVNLQIYLKNDDKKILQIYFDSIFSFRNTDESFLLKRWDHISKVSKKFSHEKNDNFSIYLVENSEFLKWFHEQSLNIYIDSKIIHYAIHTPNDCIDILFAGEPEIKWLD